MTELPLAQAVKRAGEWSGLSEDVWLDYGARFMRRKRLDTTAGRGFVVDLPQTVSLDEGDAFVLSDGTLVQVRAAAEALLHVTGPDLVRLAWHIGNRHTPCQIGKDHVLIQRDAVIGHMLTHLGATLGEVTAPFTPEGGAYGHGRTHAHDHGATAHQPHAHSHHDGHHDGHAHDH